MIGEGEKYERKCGNQYAVIDTIDRGQDIVFYARYDIETNELYRDGCGLCIEEFKEVYPYPMSDYSKHKTKLNV